MIEAHRQGKGKPWRSLIVRLWRLRIGATAWHDYAIFTVQLGHWHRSLELGWRGYVHGLRVLP